MTGSSWTGRLHAVRVREEHEDELVRLFTEALVDARAAIDRRQAERLRDSETFR